MQFRNFISFGFLIIFVLVISKKEFNFVDRPTNTPTPATIPTKYYEIYCLYVCIVEYMPLIGSTNRFHCYAYGSKINPVCIFNAWNPFYVGKSMAYEMYDASDLISLQNGIIQIRIRENNYVDLLKNLFTCRLQTIEY